MHQYKIGQRVTLVRSPASHGRVGGADTFEIIRLMPFDQTGEAAYRVKSGVMELAVRESEIRK